MELHQLRYFLALTRELSFQRAAHEANISQPTLSQQIKKLEDELGSALFERSHHRVRLTKAGQKFLPYAQTAVDTLKKGLLEIKEGSSEVSGTISLGVIPTICPYLIPSMLKVLKKNFPKIQISLYEETTSVLIEKLKEGKLDLGILALPIHEKGLVEKKLTDEEYLAAVPAGSPLAKKNSIQRKDIAKEKIITLQEGHCFSQQALDYCNLTRHDEQVIFQGSSLVSAMRLAELGEGMTFVPRMAADKKSYPGLKFTPFSPPAKRSIGVLWRISAPLLKIHHILITAAEAELKKITSL